MHYDEALRIAGTLKDLDGPNVNSLCHTRLYTHGRPVERSLVLLHGFTNCPQQFDALGRHFFARGWNVLIPRYPRHGYTDRLNTAVAELRADDLVAVANRACEAGAGLGQSLTVVGLSLGGILCGLMAQTRAIDRGVLIAPMLGLKPIPGPVLNAVSRLASRAPNLYLWWDNSLRERAGPSYGYPRFATRAYAALFETGRRLVDAARHTAPKARSIAVISNAAEPRLDNRFTYALVRSWRDHGAAVETFEFAAEEHLPHDLIDPGNAAQRTDFVYPVVARFIEGA